MILIGQYDSHFVRRVGIALTIYKLPFEHRPWSVFADAEKIAPHNPLIRVPTLVLEDGTALLESASIIDYLDHQVGAERALFPLAEPQRHHALRVASLACGLADKAVSLFYEKRLHAQISDTWVERCVKQISQVLNTLEAERQAISSTYWLGDNMGHADIAVACAWRFLNEAHPGLIHIEEYPALANFCASLEAKQVFKDISQEFIAPA